jgi:hypothetical protein
MAPATKIQKTADNKKNLTPPVVENVKATPIEKKVVATNAITKKVLITDLKVEFLATKVDDYDSTNSFFKIIDSDCITKLNPLLSLNDSTFKLPVWQTELNIEGITHYLLKVKSKYVPGDSYCIKGGLYTIDIEFVYYNMIVESESFKGYYAKNKSLKKID